MIVQGLSATRTSVDEKPLYPFHHRLFNPMSITLDLPLAIPEAERTGSTKRHYHSFKLNLFKSEQQRNSLAR